MIYLKWFLIIVNGFVSLVFGLISVYCDETTYYSAVIGKFGFFLISLFFALNTLCLILLQGSEV